MLRLLLPLLAACAIENDLSGPPPEAEPTTPAADLAPEVHELSDAVHEGVTVVGDEPFGSFRLVASSDPEIVIEVLLDGAWQPVAWDWSLDRFHNAVIALDGKLEAVEIRASAPVDYLQIELFDDEPIFDDDYPDGLPGSDPLARAHSGMWEMPYGTWLIGQGWYFPYEYATACTGVLLPGSAALGAYLVDHFAATSYQGYNCRYIAGTTTLSTHATGRAIDVFVPTDGTGDDSADNDLGDPIANFLVENADAIGVLYIIWDQASWGAHRSGDKHESYGGVHPHNDHLHIELTTTGANMLTPWFLGGMAAPFEGYSAIASTPTGGGYWIAHTDGRVDAFGDAPDHGDAEGWALGGPIVGMAPTASGNGYWLVGDDGGILSFGDAPFYGSMGGSPLAAPVVGMAPTPSGQGYWLVGEDGGVFAFGDAGFMGSMGDVALNAPVVGIVSTPTGQGYWLAAEDGGVFSFGDAPFYGSMGGVALNGKVTGIASGGWGYWMVAEDGGIFSFGPEAPFFGSMGGTVLNGVVTSMTSTPDGGGYWMVGADGGVFTFGNAGFFGSSG